MRRLLILAGLALLGTRALASEPALPHIEWRVGAAMAGLSFPAYRGSNERTQWLLPLPVFSVRTERIELGRSGANLSLFDHGALRIRLSASGSLPVDSDEVPLREGMPDLDPSFEIGPALYLELPRYGHWQLQPELLMRSVFATDLRRFTDLGWVFQPRLTLIRRETMNEARSVTLRLNSGPMFATRAYHQYFYGVAPVHARAGRPAYEADSGFSGWSSSAALTSRIGRLGVTTYLSYENLESASFADSPLLEQEHYWLLGFIVSWHLWGNINMDTAG